MLFTVAASLHNVDGGFFFEDVAPSAQKVGLSVGDELLTVTGQALTEFPPDTVPFLLAGDAATLVSVGVRRGTYKFEVKLLREIPLDIDRQKKQRWRTGLSGLAPKYPRQNAMKIGPNSAVEGTSWRHKRIFVPLKETEQSSGVAVARTLTPSIFRTAENDGETDAIKEEHEDDVEKIASCINERHFAEARVPTPVTSATVVQKTDEFHRPRASFEYPENSTLTKLERRANRIVASKHAMGSVTHRQQQETSTEVDFGELESALAILPLMESSSPPVSPRRSRHFVLPRRRAVKLDIRKTPQLAGSMLVSGLSNMPPNAPPESGPHSPTSSIYSVSGLWAKYQQGNLTEKSFLDLIAASRSAPQRAQSIHPQQIPEPDFEGEAWSTRGSVATESTPVTPIPTEISLPYVATHLGFRTHENISRTLASTSNAGTVSVGVATSPPNKARRKVVSVPWWCSNQTQNANK